MSEENTQVSFRGLLDGGARTPLREFWGVLEGYKVEMRAFEARSAEYVNLDFSLDPMVDVIDSAEPYQFPIAQISMPLNKRRTSQWTVLADSATKLMGENEDIGSLVHLRLRMKLVEHSMWNAREGKETPRGCWEVVEIVRGGAPTQAGVSPTDRALELLDGCTTEQEWNQKIFQDTLIKGDSQLLSAIISKTFLPSMQENGKAWQDGGVWHTKKE